MKSKPLVAVSACLLGQSVRYDGGHTQERWIVRQLEKHVDILPICPEVEMGMGVPREEIRLVAQGEKIRLIGKKSNKDYTDLANEVAEKINKNLAEKGVDGIILMRKSPSCGLGNVKVEVPGRPDLNKRGVGIFAANAIAEFIDVPKIDNGRLRNIELRDLFLTKIFAHFYFSQLRHTSKSIQDFHKKYKYIIMEHSHESVREMGKIAANIKGDESLVKYKKLFFETLELNPSVNKKFNVLQHLAGYLKRMMDRKDTKNLHDVLENYKLGFLDFSVPNQLIKFLIQKYEVNYLLEQSFFQRFPSVLSSNVLPRKSNG